MSIKFINSNYSFVITERLVASPALKVLVSEGPLFAESFLARQHFPVLTLLQEVPGLHCFRVIKRSLPVFALD